eukprot:GILJ01011969.1.p1 GENE.GILJ01011969.1~~GILJ01011969.1.p1  ORF type:complete len:554 (+),score=88.39 GILJ01011969.1:338-1999(+)
MCSEYIVPLIVSEDPEEEVNGLLFFSILCQTHKDLANSLILTAGALDRLIEMSKTTQDTSDKEIKRLSTEILSYVMADPLVRKSIVKDGGVDALFVLAESGPLDVRGRALSALGKLAAQDEATATSVLRRRTLLKELAPLLKSEGPSQTWGIEAMVFLSLHGEIKMQLLKEHPELVEGICKVRSSDLGVLYGTAAIILNLCRSAADKQEVKSKNLDLDSEQMAELQKLMESLPEAARPARNGVIDAGDVQVVSSLRALLIEYGAVKTLLSILQAFEHPSASLLSIVTEAMLLLANDRQNHGRMLQQGGAKVLVRLAYQDSEVVARQASQALAKLWISCNPSLLAEALVIDSIRPLLKLLKGDKELLQFESAMALTNIASANDEMKERIIAEHGWSDLQMLIFSDNVQLRRAGTEALTNLSTCESMLEKLASGKGTNDIKVFIAMSQSEDLATANAAAGALAMLTQIPEISSIIVEESGVDAILNALESSDNGLQHRALVCLQNLVQEPKHAITIRTKIATRKALKVLNSLKTSTSPLGQLAATVARTLTTTTS